MPDLVTLYSGLYEIREEVETNPTISTVTWSGVGLRRWRFTNCCHVHNLWFSDCSQEFHPFQKTEYNYHIVQFNDRGVTVP